GYADPAPRGPDPGVELLRWQVARALPAGARADLVALRGRCQRLRPAARPVARHVRAADGLRGVRGARFWFPGGRLHSEPRADHPHWTQRRHDRLRDRRLLVATLPRAAVAAAGRPRLRHLVGAGLAPGPDP